MRVTRLEIFGFKSFMDRLVLPLECGVSGVVGPNGCGKSNIVDAIRWILGETKASSLRGDSLEDVIFNGTDKLRPLGLAEVTMTIRANEDNLFQDLKSSNFEADVIAQNVADEEAATVEEENEPQSDDGRPHLTVIEGSLGKEQESQAVTEPEQAKTENASGTLLGRFSWLKAVSEVQITRRLYRSGESEFFINRVPCRLKDIKEFFRAVGLSARAYTIVAQGEVSRIVTSRPTDRRLILEDAAGILGFRDKIAAASRRLAETEINISRIDDITKEVGRQVTQLKRQASRAEARQGLKERIAQIDRELFRDSAVTLRSKLAAVVSELEAGKAQEANLEAALQRAQAEDQAVRGDLVGLDVAGDDLRSKMDAIREDLANRARSRAEKQSRVSELRAFSLARETEIRRLEERRNTLETRKVECEGTLANLKTQDAALTEQIASVDTAGGQEELRKLAASLDALRVSLRTKDQEVRTLRDTLIKRESDLKAIQDQLIAASPVNQLKSTLGDQSVDVLGGSQATLLVDGLRVPEKYASAAQAVLAERAQFLVADNAFGIARHFVGKVVGGEGDKQRHGLGLGVLSTKALPANRQTVNLPFPRLLDLIETTGPAKPAADRLLADVYVAETLEDACKYFEGAAAAVGVTVVTLAGDLVTDYSFFSLRHAGGVIQLKNRAESLAASCLEANTRHEAVVAERDGIQKKITEAEEQHRQLLKDIQERQAKARELGNEQGSIRGRQHSEQRVLSQLLQDLERVQQQIREAFQRIEEYKNEQARVEGEMAAAVPDSDNALHAELRELNLKYQELDQGRRAGRDKLSAAAEAVDLKRRELDSQRAKTNHQELDRQKLELEIGNLRQRIHTEYGPEVEQLILSDESSSGAIDDQQRHDLEAEAEDLRAKILREGDVDPTSIQRYAEESKRLADLTAQKVDLEEAQKTLKRTIEKLTETSLHRFQAIFEAVRKNFTELVPRLFGGGKGDLQLTDPSNPLESGIDIIARPPGKKLKSIELLSGGEKALCATALIFGMFKERPSPLCVLDEVDAPLDEANLARFLGLVKEMSDRTQFILVTHNKASMAVADQLVGVTMQEPGASKTITVSLQEAYSQVA